MFLEILIVLLLTVVNGVLAMSELAVVSARPARLRVLAEQGQTGAQAALDLRETPGRFLSTVQIGITLVGVLSGAFSGATLGARLADSLEIWGVPGPLADTLGVGAVVVCITYLALIVGELVPKQIALRDPEMVAARVAPMMRVISIITGPLVWVLDGSGNLILRLLGQTNEDGSQMSDEEIKMTISEAATAGVLKSDEREMIAGVMRVADRSASALMTPRHEVELIDLSDDFDTILQQARESRRSRLPLRDGGPDEVVGVISVKDILMSAEAGTHDALRALIREAPVVLDLSDATQVIDSLRGSLVHMVLVYDEYGHFQGIVTPMDVLEAITGAFRDEEVDEPACVERPDGSLLVAGWMAVDEFAERVNLPLPEDRDFDTVAGLVLDRMGRLPALGESVAYAGYQMEVVDMDGMRIDKLLVSRINPFVVTQTGDEL
ncbi:MAG: hemolysin family protein [Paracoccaceae bacterium]|jgi:putative hemolysin|nr:hemolysin family protein [Paracoccaceae bacterium]MDP5345550.1 hemolysin family protein [Paracoccaceae bacterium]